MEIEKISRGYKVEVGDIAEMEVSGRNRYYLIVKRKSDEYPFILQNLDGEFIYSKYKSFHNLEKDLIASSATVYSKHLFKLQLEVL